MNSVLSGLTGTRSVYLDDIVIYAKSLADHNGKLREILDRLRTHQLKLQPDKCEFLRTEVNYLGHQITESGVRPDPQKVAVIEQFPTPTNVKSLKTFCGMIVTTDDLSRSSNTNAPQLVIACCYVKVHLGMRYLLALACDWPAGCDRRKGGGV